MFLDELGIAESGLDRLIKCSYSLLGLISFLTYGKDECRAWTIKKGTQGSPGRRARYTPTSSAASSAPRSSPFDDLKALRQHGRRQEKGLVRLRGQGLRHEGRRRDALPLQRLNCAKHRVFGRDVPITGRNWGITSLTGTHNSAIISSVRGSDGGRAGR